MADFIPLNQSTPLQRRFQERSQYPSNYQQNRHQNNSWTPKRGGFNNRGKPSRNYSYGNGGNNNYGGDNKPNIDAFLHPSMLQDPWARLRQNQTV